MSTAICCARCAWQVHERLAALGNALKHLETHKEGPAAPKLNRALEALRKAKVGVPCRKQSALCSMARLYYFRQTKGLTSGSKTSLVKRLCMRVRAQGAGTWIVPAYLPTLVLASCQLTAVTGSTVVFC